MRRHCKRRAVGLCRVIRRMGLCRVNSRRCGHLGCRGGCHVGCLYWMLRSCLKIRGRCRVQ